MGNCIKTSKYKKEEDETEKDEQQKQEIEEKARGFIDETKKVRIKVVLTKEELEWLLFQLEGKSGKNLEDVLGEIESSRESFRGKVVSWKPSLESIIEGPHDVVDMDR